MKEERYGLVLAGGGGKGSYQIGVLKALAKLGFTPSHFHTIAGASVGSLNAALYVQDDLALAEEVWLSISPDSILSVDLRQLAMFLSRSMNAVPFIGDLASYGVFSRKGLLSIMDSFIDFHKIAQSPSIIQAACLGFLDRKVRYLSLNHKTREEIQSIVLASSALPLVFAPEVVEGRPYIDGGLKDNVPVRAAYENGCTTIFVIHLSERKILKSMDFPDAKIYELTPQRNLGSLLSGTLDFSREGVIRRISEGYEDGMRIVEPVVKMMQIQATGVQTLDTLVHQERQFKERHEQARQRKQRALGAISEGRLLLDE